MCSLIHKFGGKEEGEEVGDIPGYIAELKKSLPPGFTAKGNLFVFVDECHRTQSGELHEAMKAILPSAVFVGFTGTPLLKADKQKSIEVFGRYIHTCKFNEAVKDKVVLDLRYEARDIDQRITSQAKIDQWFDAKTKGLTDLAKAQLKQRWGTLQTVLSSQSRLEQIVADILMDMETRDRLKSGRGNALLVSGSIYQACKLYELFDKTDLKGKVRTEVKLASGDYIDLKMYEPAMRHLIDTYIQAEESVKVSAFDDLSLVQLIVERGAAAVDALPDGIRTNRDAVAEAIENNVRRLIIDEHPINPKYYEKMSELLDALIEQRRKEALDYQEYLRRIVELTKKVTNPQASGAYPATMNTPGRRSLFDNLEKDEGLALAVDAAVRANRQDGWRSNPFKIKRVRNAIRAALEAAGTHVGGSGDPVELGIAREVPADYVPQPAESVEERAGRILALVKNQDEC